MPKRHSVTSWIRQSFFGFVTAFVAIISSAHALPIPQMPGAVSSDLHHVQGLRDRLRDRCGMDTQRPAHATCSHPRPRSSGVWPSASVSRTPPSPATRPMRVIATPSICAGKSAAASGGRAKSSS